MALGHGAVLVGDAFALHVFVAGGGRIVGHATVVPFVAGQVGGLTGQVGCGRKIFDQGIGARLGGLVGELGRVCWVVTAAAGAEYQYGFGRVQAVDEPVGGSLASRATPT